MVGSALYRLANEFTAFLAGVLGYFGVIAALGVLVITILEADGVGTGIVPGPRADHAAVERPYVVNDDRGEGPNRPELRRSVAAR